MIMLIIMLIMMKLGNPVVDKLGWALLNRRLRQLAWNSGWYVYELYILIKYFYTEAIIS